MYTSHSVTKRRRRFTKALAMTRRLLLRLADEVKDTIVDAETSWFLDPFFYRRNRLTLEDETHIRRAQAYRALYQLKRKKFIEVREQSGRVMYRLTEKGRMAALKDAIRAAGDRSDGKMTVVCFDIPEQEAYLRFRVRWHLRDLGFERLQDSVWASKRDVGRFLAGLIKDIGASKWVRVLDAEDITDNYEK